MTHHCSDSFVHFSPGHCLQAESVVWAAWLTVLSPGRSVINCSGSSCSGCCWWWSRWWGVDNNHWQHRWSLLTPLSQRRSFSSGACWMSADGLKHRRWLHQLKYLLNIGQAQAKVARSEEWLFNDWLFDNIWYQTNWISTSIYCVLCSQRFKMTKPIILVKILAKRI